MMISQQYELSALNITRSYHVYTRGVTRGKTLEKLDTLNYTNIQFKASIQPVWNTNTN